MGLDHTLFRPWLDPLASDRTLVYYDHRGNGRSAAPENWGAVTHASWADDADALRAHLGFDRVAVLGHSYGAYLAMEYALRHPERVEALILVSAAPVFDYVEVVLANAGERDEALAARFIELASAPPANDRALVEGFREILPLYFHRWDPTVGISLTANLVPSAAAFDHANRRCLPITDLRDRLGRIDAPTLVISGRHDWLMPPERAGDRVAAGIPGARHVILEESGHFPFVEERRRFVEVVRAWLADPVSTAPPSVRDGESRE
jgi:proline iminopeptidase